MEALEHNIRVVADAYRDTTCKMRQHTKNIKSPLLARMQIAAGGTLHGVCTAKVSEAEVMVEGGVTDILIPNQVVTRDKIARLCALARRGDMKVCVDNPRNVQDISEVAEAHEVTIGVLIEVDTNMGRAGVRNGEAGVELARLAESLPGVKFRGVMSHQALPEYTDNESRVLVAREYIQVCLEVKDAIEAAGIPVEMVSSGETFSYDVAAGMPGVTEVEGGTYFLMCTRYTDMKEFEIANKVLGTIVSTPRPSVAIGDVGIRALSWPSGESPEVEGMPGVTVGTLLDEHIVLRTDGTTPLKVGDQFLLLPWYQDLLINRWDQFIAVRGGVVEAVWDIPARGCTQ
jgi:3-hydroxy-D-aspartate aldolase